MAPARFDTRHVYLPLSSGRRFFRLRVHVFLLRSPGSGRTKAWSSFIHVMSGRGCPLATHLRRTELPTGRAITRRLILEGCVKRGRAAGSSEAVSGAAGGPPPHTRGRRRAPCSPHCSPAGSSWPPEEPSRPGPSLDGLVSSAEGKAREEAPAAPAGPPTPAGQAPGVQARPGARTPVSVPETAGQGTPTGAGGPELAPHPGSGGLQAGGGGGGAGAASSCSNSSPHQGAAGRVKGHGSHAAASPPL